MTLRPATPADIPLMHHVRMAVLENRLSNPALITEADYLDYITARGKGWVCEVYDTIVGFAIVDLLEHNVWALFVDPRWEGRGIGSRLQAEMLDWYFGQTRATLWLSTAPGTRAEGFYRKTGWKEAGMHGAKELRFHLEAAPRSA